MEKKHTVNEYLNLDVRKIRSLFRIPDAEMTMTWTVSPGLFGSTQAQTFASTLILKERQLILTNPFDGEYIPVTIKPRSAYFGGWRMFFQCPLCSRICEILYFNPNDYGCRKCLELTYISVQEAHKLDRFIRHVFPDVPFKMAKRIYRMLFKKPLCPD
ncbi:MAG: hypothetical protein KKD69_06475 [Euryarchaeota archaeon]|nr:hypothetical protein [Euryarchaeota archaeon]